VDQSSAFSLQFIERRIALLGALSAALSAASASVVGFDLKSLESRITQQESICAEIAALDSGMDLLRARISQSSSRELAASPELRDALGRLREVQSRVNHFNRSHRLLLQRSRRTASALLHCYQSFINGTYENPALHRSAREVA